MALIAEVSDYPLITSLQSEKSTIDLEGAGSK